MGKLGWFIQDIKRNILSTSHQRQSKVCGKRGDAARFFDKLRMVVSSVQVKFTEDFGTRKQFLVHQSLALHVVLS